MGYISTLGLALVADQLGATMKVAAIAVLALLVILFFTARSRLNRRSQQILDAAEISVKGSLDPVLQPGMPVRQLLYALDERKVLHGQLEPVRKEQSAKYKNTAYVLRAIVTPQIKTPLLTCSIELEFHLNDKQVLSEYSTETPCNETALGMIFLK